MFKRVRVKAFKTNRVELFIFIYIQFFNIYHNRFDDQCIYYTENPFETIDRIKPIEEMNNEIINNEQDLRKRKVQQMLPTLNDTKSPTSTPKHTFPTHLLTAYLTRRVG